MGTNPRQNRRIWDVRICDLERLTQTAAEATTVIALNVVLVSALAGLGAVLYNISATMVGGIGMTFTDAELPNLAVSVTIVRKTPLEIPYGPPGVTVNREWRLIAALLGGFRTLGCDCLPCRVVIGSSKWRFVCWIQERSGGSGCSRAVAARSGPGRLE
ncbi:hypothetical protein BMF89_15085 [Arthrobacter sp. SRS-W-1-2016]|uniref:DUF3566 domain-containing protein n=1 Tax=Arthrobacter sp. SRS-W-1-2016 TaxID=1930254 RepID=UPI000990F932|nr:DUF3566 domain-containing protein [Arthrobacter sp. SRS-W-1-2016]OOP60955.1 hypothetical protein BMF89_15085 [Arthrobacter sp. SRS-W-1-2016]